MIYTIFAVILNTLSTVVAIIKIPFNFFLAGIATAWHLFKEEIDNIWWEDDY